MLALREQTATVPDALPDIEMFVPEAATENLLRCHSGDSRGCRNPSKKGERNEMVVQSLFQRVLHPQLKPTTLRSDYLKLNEFHISSRRGVTPNAPLGGEDLAIASFFPEKGAMNRLLFGCKQRAGPALSTKAAAAACSRCVLSHHVKSLGQI